MKLHSLELPGAEKCPGSSGTSGGPEVRETGCVFLSETHLGRARAEKLRRKLGFDYYSIHKGDGRSGGLLLLWGEIERLSPGAQLGKQMIEKAIFEGRKVPVLNNIGLAELILTGG